MIHGPNREHQLIGDLANMDDQPRRIFDCHIEPPPLGAQRRFEMLEQPRQIFVERHDAGIARRVEPLVHQRDRKDP